MDENYIKLSFLGDITCDRPMLNALKNRQYKFDDSLNLLKKILSQSDFSCANLETVFAGEKKKYNPGPITYNCPDTLATTLKNIGINLVSTANNHCLDCGKAGLIRTHNVLDYAGILHTGTYINSENFQNRFLIKKIDDIRIAFVSFTDPINPQRNGTLHPKNDWELVNQLRSYPVLSGIDRIKNDLKYYLPMSTINEIKANIKRKTGKALIVPYSDEYEVPEVDFLQINRAIDLLKVARNNSDFVVTFVHAGGQFNAQPGKHVKQIFKILEKHTDILIGNHPHVIQKIENDDILCAYSLGSVNLSLSADYISIENLPNYSLVLHIYLDKCTKKIHKVTFSILMNIEDEDGYVRIIPIDEIKQLDSDKINQLKKVFKRITGENFKTIKKEYELKSNY